MLLRNELAASLDRLVREIRGVKLAQQALFAFTLTHHSSRLC